MTRPRTFVLPFREFRRLHGRAYRAQQRDHLEICGLLYSDSENQLGLEFMENATSASCHYTLERECVRQVSRDLRNNGKHVLGTFHSHPLGDAIPSRGDLQCGFLHGVELIYDVCALEPRLWRRLGSRSKPAGCRALPLKVERSNSSHKATRDRALQP